MCMHTTLSMSDFDQHINGSGDIKSSGKVPGTGLKVSGRLTRAVERAAVSSEVSSATLNPVEEGSSSAVDAEAASSVRKRDIQSLDREVSLLADSVSKLLQPGSTRTLGTTQLEEVPFLHSNSLSQRQIRLFLEALPNRDILFLDTETTGIAKSDRVIEMAVVHRNYDRMTERRWYALINPEGTRSNKLAYNAHKLSDRLLSEQPPFSAHYPSLREFISGAEEWPLVAHNAQFDRRMLNQELARIEEPTIPAERYICTYEIARGMYGQAKGRNSLSALCTRYSIDESSRDGGHGAMQDTLLLAEVYPHLLLAQQEST